MDEGVGNIDLHSHTTFSDGTLTVFELVSEAKKRGLSALAITDHDGLEAIAPAREMTQDSSLEIVPGVEVSSSLNENTLHILGLFINPEHAGLRSYLKELREGRLTRAEKILAQLRKVDISLSLEELLRLAKGAAVGRNHVAALMVEKGIVPNRQEAFRRYLARGRPGFVTYERAQPADAIASIKAAGGLSFLAHPALVREQSLIDKLIDLGINGLEVIHPEHNAALTERYRRLCDEKGLLMSGGSDYHGPNMERKGDLGRMNVPYAFLRAMKAALTEKSMRD